MDYRERLDDPEEAIRAAFEGLMAGTWTGMPGIVESFDGSVLSVQPAIMGKRKLPDDTWEDVAMPLCVNVVPVWQGGGGLTATFPIKEGDECFLLFSNRCIDAWFQSGGVQPQADLRMHDLSDGFALTGLRSLPRGLPNVSLTAAQIRSDDGTTYISISASPSVVRLEADEINLHARNKITFDAGGTGFVYQVDKIDTYTNGVPSDTHDPNPPEVPT